MRFPHKAGPYDLLEQIGQGAFGSVYKCRERSTGRVLALKVLGKVQGEGPRRRFEREGEALARLDHPSIVRVHTATWDGDHPHLALELIEGVDLEQRLEREGPLEPEAARSLLAPLAEAVAHAHSRGVLHRDIKPSNVIVSPEGRPMLAECLVQVMSGPAPDPSATSPGIPPGLAALCRRCLAKEPGERYSSAGELAAALAAVDMSPQRPTLWVGVALVVGIVGLAGLTGVTVLTGATTESPSPSATAHQPQPEEPTPSPVALTLSSEEWDSLLFSDQVWFSTLDLDEILRRTSPEHAGRPEVLAAFGEVTGQIRRGAPWRELRASLDRLAAGPPWALLKQVLPVLRARLLFERGRPSQALQILEGDDNPGAQWLCFEIYAQRFQTPRAVAILQRLAKGKHALAKLARSRLARFQGDHKSALQLAQECTQFQHARLDVAMAQFALGDAAAGRRSLDEFLEEWGPTPVSLSLCLEVALHERDPLGALELAERASALVEVEPDSALSFQHARALLALERWTDAQALLEPLVPKARPGEALTPGDVRLLTVLGVAYHGLQATRSRARQTWSRACRGSNAMIANSSFPPEAPPGARLEFERVALAATSGGSAPAGSGLKTSPADLARAREVLETLGSSKSRLHPLAALPKELAAKLKSDPNAPQALQDLQTSRRQAASGKPWSELRFFLARALDARTHGGEVRAAWLRLALAREAELDVVERRIRDGDLPRYGLTPALAGLYLGDVAWGQKRVGEAALRYAEAAERWKGTEPGKLAAASLAILRDEFDLAQEHLTGIEEPELEGRVVALLGLTQLGQGRLQVALESARRSYASSGAEDARTLALRAAIGAGVEETLLPPPDKELELAGWTARSLTLRACLASGVPTKSAWALNSLASARDEAAEPLLLLGYALLLHHDTIKDAKTRTDTAWAAAQHKDPLLPIPANYVKAYAKAYGEKPKLHAR